MDWNTNIFCKIGPTRSPHSGVQLTNTVHLMSLPRILVSSAPLMYILVDDLYHDVLEGLANTKET